MPTQGKAIKSFSRIIKQLSDLSLIGDVEQASTKYPSFPNFARHIAKLFLEDRLFDILPRLQTQLGIIAKYNPPVRPAMDPYVSTQIGIFSKNFQDKEIGEFLGYPSCCIRPFSEETRYGFDERHETELGGIKGKIFVATAGFIPHSIFCQRSQKRGLIAFINKDDLENLHGLEQGLFQALPHFHPEYQGHYYEIKIT